MSIHFDIGERPGATQCFKILKQMRFACSSLATIAILLILGWHSLCSAATGSDWQVAASSNSWLGRTWFGTEVFQGKMWLFGGGNSSPVDMPIIHYDVWFSTDGISWTWLSGGGSLARDQDSLIFNDRLWAVGAGEAHWSLDGETWTHILRGPSTFYSAAAVFAGKMWLLGGKTYNSEGGELYLNNSYSSVDGSSWSRRSAPWRQYGGVMALVFAGKLWVMGGGMARVWSSSDGVNWQEAPSDAPWGVRYFPAAAVADGKMWILGGNRAKQMNGQFLNDVWCTSDGVNWTQVTSAAAWCPRGGHRALVYKNKLWVIGGVTTDSHYLNDVWYSDLPPPPPLTITESPRGAWVEASNPWKLSAAASGGIGPITYQWKKDSVDLSGATDATYDIPSLAVTDTGWYVCEITDSAKTTVTTSPVLLQVFPYDSLPAAGPIALILTAAGCLLLPLLRTRHARRRKQ